jgi:hypothetical protein|tara:strand:+ start:76 stop:345 length:270 start_codon:yes stop_codon:yes gene_type:complete
MGLSIEIELENGQWSGTLTMSACEAAKNYQPEVLRFLAKELKKNRSLVITTMHMRDSRIRVNGVWNSAQLNRFSRFHDQMFREYNKNES